MIRDIDLNEVSDGKLYRENDMVKAGCDGCKGCSQCCREMGDSILLDPLDIHRMKNGLSVSFENLMEGPVGLRVVDGLILPFLKMTGKEESCAFLNDTGRCTIHDFRPGFCRLFPLGRYYEGEDFRYFLQIHECAKKNRTKVKVKKWIDVPDFSMYEDFIRKWHAFQRNVQEKLDISGDEDLRKKVDMQILQDFYVNSFDPNDFYGDFYHRIDGFIDF